MIQPALLASRLNDRPVRTGRGNEFLKRDAREIPRRLRGVLLAIDGRQSVRTYVEKLDGFGDVAALIGELMALGLVELHSGSHRRPSAPAAAARAVRDSGFTDSVANSSGFGDTHPSTGGYDTMKALIDDPREVFQTLAASTIPGGFDDLVRVARLDNQDYAPPVAPMPPPDPGRQLEGLFNLLDAVRGERKALRDRVASLRKYRDRCQQLQRENARLTNGVFLLALACGVLVVLVLVLAVRR